MLQKKQAVTHSEVTTLPTHYNTSRREMENQPVQLSEVLNVDKRINGTRNNLNHPATVNQSLMMSKNLALDPSLFTQDTMSSKPII